MFDDLDPKEFEDTARAVMESCTGATGPAARAALLAEAGLLGVAAPEESGGLGLPLRFAVPILEAAGAGLLAFPLVETMLLTRALAGLDDALATEICAGGTLATIAWAGTSGDARVGNAPMGQDAALVLIFHPDGSAVLARTGFEASAGDGLLDVDAPAADLRLSGPLEGVLLDAERVAILQAEARILRSAYLAGSAAKCLQLAVDYAQDRVQFGRPLSGYQVIRHRLSRDALAVETMRSGLARALSDIAPDAADMAAQAVWLGSASSGPEVAESAIQVFGGMGFTWEVPLHHHLRQMRSQASYGAASAGLETLGATLLQGHRNAWYEGITDVV